MLGTGCIGTLAGSSAIIEDRLDARLPRSGEGMVYPGMREPCLDRQRGDIGRRCRRMFVPALQDCFHVEVGHTRLGLTIEPHARREEVAVGRLIARKSVV